MAVHGVPRAVDPPHDALRDVPPEPACAAARWRAARATWRAAKQRLVNRMRGTPYLVDMFWANTNRDQALPELFTQPNIDNSPFAQPIRPAVRRAS